MMHSTDQHSFGYTPFAMFCNVTNNFAATCGVSDVDGVLEIEMGRQRSEVVGVVVHVVTVAGLGGASVPTPVMGDDAIALL